MLSDEKKAVIRGLILKSLANETGWTLSDIAIKAILSGYSYSELTEREVLDLVEYLSGEGYVVSKRKNRDILLVTMTSKWVKLLESQDGLQDSGINIA